MQPWLESIKRLFEDPSRNATAVTAAVAIAVLIVIIVVLILVAYALPGAAQARPMRRTRQRRIPRWAAILLGTGIGVTVAAAAVTLWYSGTSSNEYCTKTCHSMAGPTESWTLSAHADVECIRCHEGRRWSSMPQGVASRGYSLYLELSGDTPRGLRIPPSRCLECHRDTIMRSISARNGEEFSHTAAFEEDNDCTRCHGDQGHEPSAP